MEMQNKIGFGIMDCLTEASPGWKCFGVYNKDREFYTFDDKYFSDYMDESIKEGKVAALNGYFESNKCDEIVDTIKKI